MSSQQLSKDLREARQELSLVREQVAQLRARQRILEVKIDNLQHQANIAAQEAYADTPPNESPDQTCSSGIGGDDQSYESPLSPWHDQDEPVYEGSYQHYSPVKSSPVKRPVTANPKPTANQSTITPTKQYGGKQYPWSAKVDQILKTKFKLKEFRSKQLPAINATLSNQDCIVIMPTGGGKSLCFQLPALINDGITIVVSPLLSLMEDQVLGLKELNIETCVLNGETPLQEVNEIYRAMTDKDSTLKVIYVTPEKVARTKRLLSQMEKCYEMGRLSRVVIDEVHCCSQWGHDFRKDYKLLEKMKQLFPETPILGLTATATFTVIADIQKILGIEGCLILKDSFFRPNLNYVIERMDCKRDDQIQKIAFLLKNKYYNQSGIIYCLTIKDVEDVTVKLRSMGVKANAYHAQLSADQKSKTHNDWYKNRVQVIVATIAFGMGINKHDVRFVFHFSMSKSLENYYQETGRAGRDGKDADCILYFRYADIFRATTLIFNTTGNKKKIDMVYDMVRYCLTDNMCRKEQIAIYFGDKWNHSCDNKCDNCQNQCQLNEVDCTKYLEDLVTILQKAGKVKEKMTALKLVDAWRSKTNKYDVIPPNLSKDICLQIIGLLLVDHYLEESFSETSYGTNTYLIPGPRAIIRHRMKDLKIPYWLNCHQLPAVTSSASSASEFSSIRKTKKTTNATKRKSSEKRPKPLEETILEPIDDIGATPSQFSGYFPKELSPQSSPIAWSPSPEYSRKESIVEIPSYAESTKAQMSSSMFSKIESSGSDTGSVTEFKAVVKTRKHKRLKIESENEESSGDVICLE